MTRAVHRIGALLLAAIVAAALAGAGCKKKPQRDEVPQPAEGWQRFTAAGVRIDIPEDWTLSQYDARAAMGPPTTEVAITPPESQARVQLSIIHLYIRDKTDDELLELFSLAYTALYREGVRTLMEIDTQAGKANGMELDVPVSPMSDGQKHRFWIVRIVGRTVQVHETLPYTTPPEVAALCTKVVQSIGKAADYLPGETIPRP